MDFTVIQATTNLISLVTIICFAKRLFLQHEEEFNKKWYITGLIASDGLMAIGHILIIGNAWALENDSLLNLCKFQGFLIHYGMICSFMWINIIVLVIFNSLTAKVELSTERTVLFCMGGPLVYCLL